MKESIEKFPAPTKEKPKITPVEVGQRFRIGNEVFTYAGVNEETGKPVGKREGEELYEVFDKEQLRWGILLEFKESFKRELTEIDTEIDELCREQGR